MSELDQYFVSLGVKGQNVVLKNIDKVQKAAKGLSRSKSIIELGEQGVLKGLYSASHRSPAGVTAQQPQLSPEQKRENKEQKKENKEQAQSTNRFARGVKNFGNASKNFASSASTMDPTAIIKSASSSIGESLSGLTIAGFGLGNMPKGMSEMTNAMLDMATNAVSMTKEAAAGQFGLTHRNTTVKYYGGDMGKAANAGISNMEYANLISKMSGSFGQLKKPMQDLVNELAKTKDTEALGRVASGNFESTGTDKGWMYQKMADSLGDLPPSMRQAIMTPMIKSMSGEIQEKGGQAESQRDTAKFQRLEEKQTAALYGKSHENKAIVDMIENMNAMQAQLFDVGTGFASAIGTATTAIGEFPETIRKVKEAIQTFASTIGVESLSNLTRLNK